MKQVEVRQTLLTEYPDGMSKEQFCKIANISKRKATWLLNTGLIPCERSDKITWRYSIKTEDVIFYLENRIAHPEEYEAPPGTFSSRSTASYKSLTKNNVDTDINWEDAPDALTLAQAANLSHHSVGYLKRRISCGQLYAASYYGKTIVSKRSLMFLVLKT